MSFFGFDPSAPPGSQPKSNKNLETLDFNDLEEDDAFNDETFGAAALSNMKDDFDFALGDNSKSKSSLKPAPAPAAKGISYATAAHTSVDDVLQPMASLWADEKTSDKKNQEVPRQNQVLSLEEIEAKLKSQSLPSQPPLLPTNNDMMQNQFQIPPYITQALCQPQIQQQIMAAVSSGRFPNLQTATQAMVQMIMSAPNQMMQVPPSNMQPQFGVQQNQQMQEIQQQMLRMQMQQQQQQQMQQQMHLQQPQPPTPQHQQQELQQNLQPAPQQIQAPQQPIHIVAPVISAEQLPLAKVSLNDYPSIEVASAKSHGQHTNHNESAPPNVEQDPKKSQEFNQTQLFNQQRSRQFQYNNDQNHQNQRYQHHQNHHQRQQQLQQQLENMSPEERENFLVRQQKVHKITRCSGFMTPKDKDFVTRFQLSQIVTDDPYNEDFYYQVYKVLNSSTGENNMNSLAQKYLEQSGHRLGGRSKRADIALQRMQQQVSKAVSVAKERGESTGILTKEGALGKVSFGSGKQPRRQLIIHSQDSENGNDQEPTTSRGAADVVLPKEYTFSKSSRTFQLSIIEKIYNEVLKLESLERENQPYETTELWNSLHLNDVIKTSTNEVVDPFISILSFDKMMKLFGRMFHFLTADQKIELLSQLFLNLQNIDVIMKGSYKNYENSNYETPDEIIKKIDLFQMTILKCLVLYLSEANFSYVLTWLNTLVSNKSILFLTTTKIGLSLITVLISRLELVKQEFSKSLNAQELSQWQYVYDQLFQCLEGRLTSCFPPYISHDENRKVTNKESKSDDSYVWQFLASLSLAGMLNHQRIIIDEIRNEIFGIMAVAKELKSSGDIESATRYLGNLNLFLNVMGLIATEDDITELSD